jgi:L-arabinose isomerase
MRISTVVPLCARAAISTSRCAPACIEIGIGRFLQDGNFKGFTTTFEDSHAWASCRA